MKILVTGGTGFIGSHLVKALLKAGHQVRVFTRSSKEGIEGVEVVEGSFESPDDLAKAVAGCDFVYHLAAIPGMRSGLSWEDYFKANVAATENLLKAVEAARVKRFVYCSSISVYGLPPKGVVLNESSAPRPTDLYGRSKLEAEEIVRRGEIPFTLVRPAIVYGPGDTNGMMLKLMRLLKKRLFALVGSGENVIPLVYIDDLVDLFLLCLKDKAEGGTFLGVSGSSPTLKELAGTVAAALGVPLPSWRIPESLIGLFGLFPFGIKEKLETLTSDRRFSPSKARKTLGWEAKVPLEKGIRETVSWYEKHDYL